MHLIVMELEDVIKVHSVGFGLEEVKVEFKHELKMDVSGVKIEGKQVIVGFSKAESVACSRIQKEENRRLVSQVCQDVIGAAIQLRVVELTESQEDGLTMKQARVQKRTQDEKSLLEEARANPLVKQTMELFGGEVIKASRMVEKKETQ